MIEFPVLSCTQQQLKGLFLHTCAVQCTINSEIVPLYMAMQQQLIRSYKAKDSRSLFKGYCSFFSILTGHCFLSDSAR